MCKQILKGFILQNHPQQVTNVKEITSNYNWNTEVSMIQKINCTPHGFGQDFSQNCPYELILLQDILEIS